jgi:hypothetical protein
MSTSAEHADWEALSAYVDGEAPEWADHVAGCPACQATAEEIRALVASVRQPVEPPAASDRDATIAAALAASSPGAADVPLPPPVDLSRPRLAPERPVTGRSRPSKPWAWVAVAAVVVGVLGFSGMLLSSSRTSDHETATLDERSLDGAKAGGESGVAAAAPQVAPTDLGDVRDAATLKARFQTASPVAAPALSRTSDDAAGGVSGVTGNASGGAGAAVSNVVPPTTTLTQRPAARNVVGTRPCEEQIRGRNPGLGEVTYFATARQGTVEAYVLGFATGPPPAQVTLLLLARTDCAELVRAAVP